MTTSTAPAKAPVFDKVQAAGKWGAAAALAVTLAQTVFPDLRIEEGAGPEETFGRIVAHLIPVIVAFVAAYLKRERSGYGAVATVITTGDVASSAAAAAQAGSSVLTPDPPKNTPQRPQEPTRYGGQLP